MPWEWKSVPYAYPIDKLKIIQKSSAADSSEFCFKKDVPYTEVKRLLLLKNKVGEIFVPGKKTL